MQFAGFYRTYNNYLHSTAAHMVVYCNETYLDRYNNNTWYTDPYLFIYRRTVSLKNVYSSFSQIISDLKYGTDPIFGTAEGVYYPLAIVFVRIM